MECSGEQEASETRRDLQRTDHDEMDEEEEYMEALNASLLIQTPLQVSLETIRKRLRKQAKSIEALSQRLSSQDVALVHSKTILSRVQKTEQGLMDLKTSKLSPFVQSEILKRLEQLERDLESTNEQWTSQLEASRLQYRLDLLQHHKQPREEIDNVSEREEERLSVSKTEAEAENSKRISMRIEVSEQMIAETQDRLYGLEMSLSDQCNKLQAMCSEIERKQADELCSIQRCLDTLAECPKSEVARIESRVDVLEERISFIESKLTQRNEQTDGALVSILDRLKALETRQQVSGQRIEALVSAALADRQQRESSVSRVEFEQLQQDLKQMPSVEGIRSLVHEIISQQQRQEKRDPPGDSMALEPSFVHSSRLSPTSMICDRDRDRNYSNAGYESESHPLPLYECLRTTPLSQLRPLGPGLHAAELRQLHFTNFTSDGWTKSKTVDKETVDNRAFSSLGINPNNDCHQLLFDERQKYSKPIKYIRRTKTPVFL